MEKEQAEKKAVHLNMECEAFSMKMDQVYYPLIEELIAQLKTYATEWANIPMLAKTHGQPASPTRLGKEGKSTRFTNLINSHTYHLSIHQHFSA